MTFKERYDTEQTWHGKAIIMEILHLAGRLNYPDWTLAKTAHVFEVSIALVSENLKLADAIHRNERLTRCKTRQEALQKVSRNGRIMEAEIDDDI